VGGRCAGLRLPVVPVDTAAGFLIVPVLSNSQRSGEVYDRCLMLSVADTHASKSSLNDCIEGPDRSRPPYAGESQSAGSVSVGASAITHAPERLRRFATDTTLYMPPANARV
jgi:hypothetical protein